MKNKVGHTSSTILNSCSFQRYRLSIWNLYSILLTQALLFIEIPNRQTNVWTDKQTDNAKSRATEKLSHQSIFSSVYFLINHLYSSLAQLFATFKTFRLVKYLSTTLLSTLSKNKKNSAFWRNQFSVAKATLQSPHHI